MQRLDGTSAARFRSADGKAVRNSERRPDGYTNHGTHAIAERHSNGNADVSSDGFAERNAGADRDTDFNANANINADTNTDADGNAHADSNGERRDRFVGQRLMSNQWNAVDEQRSLL